MPILLEYALLAMLGSAPATGGAAPSNQMQTLDANALAQPAGGTIGDWGLTAGLGLMGQTGGGSTDSKTKPETGKKPLSHMARRAHKGHKGHRSHSKVIKQDSGKKASKE